jgi:AcrR family transcriptional regulator
MSNDLPSRIMRSALILAARHGIAATSRNSIAAHAECSSGSVSFHFGNDRELKRAIVRAAIERENLAVIGWSIAERHPSAQALDSELRARALRKHLEV